jgi:uncharacterized protein (DUF58 family)
VAVPAPSAQGVAGRCHLTPAGAGVIGAGIAILGLSLYALNLLLFAVALLAIGFVAIEYLGFAWLTRGFDERWFGARREGTVPRVDVHGTGSAGVTLSHQGPRGIYVEIFDSHPDDFEMRVGSPRLRTFLSPGASATLFYVFRPGTRGLYTVGPTSVVAHDALGLVFRTALLDTRANLFVTPPRPALGAGASFARLHTRMLGVQSLRRRGYGTEFRSLREYLPTDDYRTIAWKRSGKGKYYVREFEQENRQDFLVLLDTSAGMSVGLPGQAALDKAVEAAQVLIAYVAKREDRIGLLGWASGASVFVPPGRGPAHFTTLTRALAAVQVEQRPFDGAGALAFLSGNLKSRTHVIVFTALTDPTSPFRSAYGTFTSKGHRLYAFTPSVGSFYPPVPPGLDDRALRIAREVEGRREHGAVQSVHALGIPLFTYEGGGAVDPVVALYTSLRAWGSARG